MYTRFNETIYLSLRAQVAVGTFFMKSPVYKVVPRVGQVGREASVFVGEPGDDGGGCSLVVKLK